MLKIETERLEIVAEDLSLARAGVEGREALAAGLSATVPNDWPPEIMAGATGYWVPHLEKNPDLVGWAVWHIIRKEDRILIGGAGFKGMPDAGRVDIGYAVLDAFQRRGYATEAAGALIDWAFSDPRVDRIVGETLPHLSASIRVMQRLGFELVDKSTTGHGGEENVVRYVLNQSCV
ncbi:MAG: GNAT family N-acetyltransferase [Planctomycetes bacterium]|nr:GNAT family N-acetyltransferase [Planctomycetota bacterium]